MAQATTHLWKEWNLDFSSLCVSLSRSLVCGCENRLSDKHQIITNSILQNHENFNYEFNMFALSIWNCHLWFCKFLPRISLKARFIIWLASKEQTISKFYSIFDSFTLHVFAFNFLCLHPYFHLFSAYEFKTELDDCHLAFPLT